MNIDVRDVVEVSIEALLKEVVALTLDGWAISQSNPGDALAFGQSFTVSMYRDEDTIEAFRVKASGVAEKPKATRAEILAVARAAKGNKAKLDIGNVQS